MLERKADEALLKFLAKHGRIESWMAEAVEEYVRTHGVSVIEALCDGGFIDESAIADLFEQALRIPRAKLDAFPPRLARPLDPETLKLHLATPTEIDRGRLALAMVNPLDYEAIRKVHFMSGLRVVPAVATLTDIRTALARPAEPPPEIELPKGERAAVIPVPERRPDPGPHSSNISPIVRMASLFIERGVALRASDLHLDPTPDGLTVRYRIDGILEEATRLSASVRSPLVARFKVMANLDIAERRVPQDGGISLTVAGRPIDCRVSTLPTQYGEKVVIRLLDTKRALVSLDQLGFEPGELTRVEECLRQSDGMILTTGPTGSGKSTTLYAMLRAIQTPELNIVTVENPIEYRLPGITQTEVNERQGLTFPVALRSILRQDPDVILIGEIRDHETAEIAVQAAQTGHLVLSTLHTNDSVGVITRLVKLGMEREMIASTLLLIIAQRLVRVVCPHCATRVPASTWADLPWYRALGGGELARGQGCSDCRQTGYFGRRGVYEIFRNTTEVKRLIIDAASELDLRDSLRRQGGRTLMQVALDKIHAGETTPDEVGQVIKHDEGAKACDGCGADVDERFRTCPHCGSALRRECPTCGSTLQEGWERCPACGTAIAVEVAAPPAPERQMASMKVIAPKNLAAGPLIGAGVRGLCAAAGLDEVAAAELELAVVEACSLACSSGGEGGELLVDLELSVDGHSICISDEGPPWTWPRPQAKPPDMEQFSEAASPDVRAFLIRSSVDEASYERTERRNRLWLVKRPTERADVGGRYGTPESMGIHT